MFYLNNICFILNILSVIILPFAIGAPQVPCFFIFGDSLVDNGNNNDLVTQAKVNYLPYGIDFPLGPTGRFTNGRNTADILGSYFALSYVRVTCSSDNLYLLSIIFFLQNLLSELPFAAKLLGFENYIPPFATAQGRDFVNGVNYGSGSAGIRSETGQQLVNINLYMYEIFCESKHEKML